VTEPREQSRWLRLALRAYPRHWRETRENELLGVLRDSVPDRPRWPGARMLLDLVRGGWRTRARLHPPFWRWMGYRFLGRRVPAAWHDWTRRDINGRWWALRRLGIALAPMAILSDESLRIHGSPLSHVAGVAAVVGAYLLVSWATTPHARSRTLRHYGLADQPVDEVWRMTRVWWPAPVRTRATPLFAATAVTLMVGAPFFGWALLDPDRGVTRPGYLGWLVAAAAIIGVVLLGIAGAALWRQVPARLATRAPGAQPIRSARTTYVVGLVAVQALVEAGLVDLQRNEWVPGAFCLLLITAAVSVGPAMLWLFVIARRAERVSGIDVTWLDCGRAVFAAQDVITPELGQWVDMPRLVVAQSPQRADSLRTVT
jgi:hypothetical protein